VLFSRAGPQELLGQREGERMWMHETLVNALFAGYERIVAWADILDRINVYPVPDGDTGRNLVMTLSALRNPWHDEERLGREILLTARGNSGNIVARFLAGFLRCEDLSSLPASVEAGRDLAYKAVADPHPGTMLSLFDAFAESLKANPPERTGVWVDAVAYDLEASVKATTQQLQELREAGVVDSGALGMLVFFDPLLRILAGRGVRDSGFTEELKNFFSLSGTLKKQKHRGYCLDVVLKLGQEEQAVMGHLMQVGESVVAMPEGDCLKIHLHTIDRERLKQSLATHGSILTWGEDDLAEQTLHFSKPEKQPAIHIMTDAAGCMTREAARSLGVTLLNSYVTVGNRCLPESYLNPSHLFEAMKGGVPAFTSQASIAERHECYSKVLKLYGRVLYLCVGSFYTGNHSSAMGWKAENDPEDRMIVVDTGLASGRLGLAARATAEISLLAGSPSEVVAFARTAIQEVQEYIFLDRLQFAAAGGRMSKSGAFLGDMLRIKPIVSPYPDGVRKMGVARNKREQVRFAFERVEEGLARDQAATLFLEYTDNKEWLEKEIRPEIEARFPRIRVIMQIMSMTSAVHMGPGTWGIAFLPGNPGQAESDA
jgi:DegV family protein with EDD domain